MERSMNEDKSKTNRRKIYLKIARAFLITAASGIFWFVLWFLFSMFLAEFPYYLMLFSIMAWSLLFFTFVITVTEGTIYKYLFTIVRSFFLIAYLAYSTNYGVFTAKLENFTFTVEFVPLLALMIVINLLSIARGLLQALEFAAQSPKD